MYKIGDIVCVLLGCDTPVILRPQPRLQPQPSPQSEISGFEERTSQLPRPSPPGEDTEFLFVGPCFVYGLDDANGLLGPLPKPWRVQVFTDESGLRSIYKFLNPDTGVLSEEDPRLPPLDGDKWERAPRGRRTGDDPITFQRFRNKLTGEVVNYDPRMDRDALEARGVRIREFNLV